MGNGTTVLRVSYERSSVKDMEEKLRTEREAKETLDGQVAELREIQRNDEMAREHAAQRRK